MTQSLVECAVLSYKSRSEIEEALSQEKVGGWVAERRGNLKLAVGSGCVRMLSWKPHGNS
jgi:hypothetical protein